MLNKSCVIEILHQSLPMWLKWCVLFHVDHARRCYNETVSEHSNAACRPFYDRTPVLNNYHLSVVIKATNSISLPLEHQFPWSIARTTTTLFAVMVTEGFLGTGVSSPQLPFFSPSKVSQEQHRRVSVWQHFSARRTEQY